MKIKSLDKLEKSISNDLQWRKREFTSLKFMIDKSRNHEKLILLRSAIPLLYSHWEGHIKHCSLVYLSYINSKGITLEELTDNFCQIYLGRKFDNNFSIKNIDNQKMIHDYFKNLSNEKFNISPENTIKTKSNLNTAVFNSIIFQLGLPNKYNLKEAFIDEKLLKRRNEIAHGTKIDQETLEEVYKDINADLLNIIQLFHDEILNFAQNESFLKQLQGDVSNNSNSKMSHSSSIV